MRLSLTTTPYISLLHGGGAVYKEDYNSDDELLDTEEYIKGLHPLLNPYEDSRTSQRSK